MTRYDFYCPNCNAHHILAVDSFRSIERLALETGSSPKTVRKEMESLIIMGLFPGASIDNKRDRIVFS